MTTNIDRLIEILSKYDYVSFDAFDTLVLRNVAEPKDVFRLVENKIKKDKTGLSDREKKNIDSFYVERASAELKARQEKKNQEVTLEDIYDQMPSSFSLEQRKVLKETEIQIEETVTVPNTDIKKAYEYCLKTGKHIFITTDMYLSEETIQNILAKCGYKNYDKLYLSSTIGFTKNQGTLYDYILSDIGISPKKLIHIGDNIKSDILMPRRKGIHTYYLQRKKYEGDGSFTQRTLNAFLINSEKKSFGFQYFGPLLFGYVNWLNAKLIEGHYDKVLFFSREGYFIKKAYDLVKSKNSPDSMYFFASRRALQVPAMWLDLNYESVMTSMFLPYHFSVAWLIEHWGLKPQECKTEIEEADLSKDYIFDKFSIIRDKNATKLFYLLKEKIEKNSKKEYKNFFEYLEKNEVKGNVAIVDIGWNGNMQQAFQKIIKSAKYPMNITGYYLGYTTSAGNQKRQKMKGYIHSREKKDADFLVDLYCETTLELLFMAPHGTTIRYLNNGDVELAGFEYAGTNTRNLVVSYQRECLSFIKDFLSLGNLLENDQADYTRNILALFKKPTLRKTNYIGDLKAWDHQWIPMAEPRKLYVYLLHPAELKKDISNNSWKIGFLKRLLKIPFPYYETLRKARSIWMNE